MSIGMLVSVCVCLCQCRQWRYLIWEVMGSLWCCPFSSLNAEQRAGFSSMKYLSIPLSLSGPLAHITSDRGMLEKTPHWHTHVHWSNSKCTLLPRVWWWLQLQLGGRPEEDCSLTLLAGWRWDEFRQGRVSSWDYRNSMNAFLSLRSQSKFLLWT